MMIKDECMAERCCLWGMGYLHHRGNGDGDGDSGNAGGGPNDWCLRIIAEPRQGSTAKDNVGGLQHFLRHNPPQPASIVPEPDIVVLTAMPDAVLVLEEEKEIVYVLESELHKYYATT
jgi:hypothetical protein